MVHSIRGLEDAEIVRFGYAIEYDFAPATQLHPTLETKRVENLYFAGQLNGTTGYEEAAAQGIMAGINAALKVCGEEPLVLDRSQAYTGVLIDDLVTMDIREPYRMFTSRAEYRLELREDNADLRLTQIGHQIGLVNDEAYHHFQTKRQLIRKELERLNQTVIKPSPDTLARLKESGITQFDKPTSVAALLKRPEINYQQIKQVVPPPRALPGVVEEQSEIQIKYEGYIRRQAIQIEQSEIQIKYEGYIRRQAIQIEQFKKLENFRIPDDFDYENAHGLKTEAREQLAKIRPTSIGQASRIPGVTPADISILMVLIHQKNQSELRAAS
jgi:tRNA uridine 5-carboxymethylaminomethyl modification enzyme